MSRFTLKLKQNNLCRIDQIMSQLAIHPMLTNLTMSPGSCALRGILFQFSPASEVYKRIAGFPTIQPSFPLKLMELNLQLKSSSSADGIDLGIQVCPPSFVSKIVCLVPRRNPTSQTTIQHSNPQIQAVGFTSPIRKLDEMITPKHKEVKFQLYEAFKWFPSYGGLRSTITQNFNTVHNCLVSTFELASTVLEIIVCENQNGQ